jgi:hypothetical protein
VLGEGVDLKKLAVAILLAIIALNLPRISPSQSQSSIQVGARGDDASAENLGVRAQVQTHLYSADPAVLDYFWVGTTLSDGAFVQFGWALEPGQFCLKGALVNGEFRCDGASVLLSDSDARWQWQYWPNARGNDFYYEIGPARSAGLNGTWHQYSIAPSPNQTIRFLIDGEQVANANFRLESSKEPLMVVAEKVAAPNGLGTLGPVEFRGLEYLERDGWHAVDSLISLISCGLDTSCANVNTYGVTWEEPNLIIAGSGGQIRTVGQLLWTSSYVTLNVTVHSGVQFHISTVRGDHVFVGSAYTNVPKGMFADVWLTATRTRLSTPLGLFGAFDEFQGWMGYGNSSNQSIRVLMDRNRSVQATWHTNLEPVAYTTTLAVMLLVAILAFMALRLRKHLNARADYRWSLSV